MAELEEKVQITWEDGMWSRREVYNKGSTVQIPGQPPTHSSGFLGWFTLQQGGEQISDNLIASKNETYFAHWDADTHIVVGYD